MGLKNIIMCCEFYVPVAYFIKMRDAMQILNFANNRVREKTYFEIGRVVERVHDCAQDLRSMFKTLFRPYPLQELPRA